MSDSKRDVKKNSFYFPEQGVAIEADTYEDAVAKLKDQTKGTK